MVCPKLIKSDFQVGPNFSSTLTANIPQGTTQVITTITWQGSGSINATITTPSQTYTEAMIPVYQMTTYSTTSGPYIDDEERHHSQINHESAFRIPLPTCCSEHLI